MRRSIMTALILALVPAATAPFLRPVAGGKVRRVPQRRAAAILEITSQPRLTITRAIGGPGRLDVAAEAAVGDIRVAQRLAWHLKVFRVLGPRSRELAWHDRYDAQPLLIPAGVVKKPAFHEGLIMPAGDYTVQVGIEDLDRAPPGNLVVTRVARLTVR